MKQRIYDIDSILSIFCKRKIQGNSKLIFSSIVLNKLDSLELLPYVALRSKYIVLADGAANYYKQIMKEQNILRQPDIIVGDLESITPQTIEYFNSQKVKILQVEDQNYSDFLKSFKCLEEQYLNSENQQEHNIIFIGGISGRLDHLFNNINYLQWISTYLDNKDFKGKVYIIDQQNLGFFVLPGCNKINVASSLIDKSTTGIIPFRERASKVTTKGLRWNLQDDDTFSNEFFFGNKISSSNEILENTIEIQTDFPLLITMGLNLKQD